MERRAFLQLLNGTLGAALLARPLTLAAARSDARLRVLDAHEAALLEAVCAQILPPVNGVSTRAAGCVNFIDKALAHEDAAELPEWRAGLAALEACARAAHAMPFAELPTDAQRVLLERLEDAALEGWTARSVEQAALFSRLRTHTLLGFLAAPAFGGNRDGRGWSAIGFGGDTHRHGAVSDAAVSGLEEL